MSRFRIYSVFTIESLIMALSSMIELLSTKSSKFEKPDIIVIDSLSMMACTISHKATLNQLLKEVQKYVKNLNKKYYVMVIIIENTEEGPSKISEIVNVNHDCRVIMDAS